MPTQNSSSGRNLVIAASFEISILACSVPTIQNFSATRRHCLIKGLKAPRSPIGEGVPLIEQYLIVRERLELSPDWAEVDQIFKKDQRPFHPPITLSRPLGHCCP
jgi:hypothetical protein